MHLAEEGPKPFSRKLKVDSGLYDFQGPGRFKGSGTEVASYVSALGNLVVEIPG